MTGPRLARPPGIACAALLWLAALSAHAQDAPARIELTGCRSELGAEVEPALDVELSSMDAETQRALADGTIRCALVCDASGATAVVTRGTERLEQRIAGDAPGLARRLAIALAELIHASGAPDPDPDPEPDANPGPDPDAARHTRLRIAGGAWIGGEPLLVLGAFELGVELDLSRNLAIVAGAAGALGGLDVDEGHLAVRLVSAHASLRLGAPLGAFWIGGGPAIRGGAVLWSGRPNDTALIGRDTTGGWLGLGAVAATFVRLGRTPLRIGLEVEGGGIAFHSGAEVLGEVAARIGGGWIEPRLVVDLALR